MNEIEEKIYDKLENLVKTTKGEEQQQWGKKRDIFWNRNLYKKFGDTEGLEKVEQVKKEVLECDN